MARAPAVDVEAAAAGVAGGDVEPLGAALAGEVHEDPLHALLVKLVVVV